MISPLQKYKTLKISPLVDVPLYNEFIPKLEITSPLPEIWNNQESDNGKYFQNFSYCGNKTGFGMSSNSK